MALRSGRALFGGIFTLAMCSVLGAVGLDASAKSPAARPTPATDAAAPARVGGKVPAFRLPDTAGKSRTLAEFKDKKAVVLVFLGTECPISNDYSQPLSEIEAQFRSRGVQFLGVNALAYEDTATVAKHAREYRLSFPVLKDARQELVRAVDARVTPEVFVLDGSRTVRYRGRVDDAYASRTEKRRHVKSRDLRAALEAVLAGKPVAQPVTRAFGCAIPREFAADTRAKVTYYGDVASILQENCQGCHRPGQVAPFSLMTYNDAKNWAEEIKSFTQNRQMPPWQAEPGHGEFQDARRLSDRQVAALSAWVDAGAPAGNPKGAPAPKQWPNNWMLGEPDLVLEMPEEYSVGANGEDDFRCFVLPTGLAEDKQVVAVEVRPGNPRVVHHVINFIDTAGRGRALDARDAGVGYNSGPGGVGFLPQGGMGGWAPGNFPRWLPRGVGMHLPKNSDLVMQVHYHKTGKPEKDRTRVGLYFAKQPVEKRFRVFPLTWLLIDIPPGAPRHEVRASMTVPADAHAIGITPHMHLLGKEMKVTATLPDGTEKSLVWVKNWDYRWQDTYTFKSPVALPKGTKITMVAYFDNTAENPRNPNNPPKRVTFGEQTTDEMAFAFISYTFDEEPKGKQGFSLFSRR